jgi:hypothetical protein
VSYVLILAPAVSDRWPAVIGGYETREDAVIAGMWATEALTGALVWLGLIYEYGDVMYAYNARPWHRFTVIPGGAGHEAQIRPGAFVRVSAEELLSVIGR